MKANAIRYYNGAVAADFNGTPFNLTGGSYVLGFFGTLGGGTAKLQWSPDDPTGSTWFDLGPQNGVVTTLAAAGTVSVKLPPCRARVAVTGSTAPSAVVWLGDAADAW